jgi:hypothetical protein
MNGFAAWHGWGGMVGAVRCQLQGDLSGDNLDLIVNGMTQADVEEIFGCPPGDYTNGEALSWRCGIGSPTFRKKIWTGYGGDIEVNFRKDDGKAVDKFYMETRLWRRPTWIDRIKGLFKDAFSAGS